MDVPRLGVVSMFYASGFGLMLFSLPLTAYNINSDLLVVGVVAAVPAAASMLSALPAGNLIDSYGRKKTALIGLSLMLCSASLMGRIHSTGALALAGAILGVGSQLIYSSLKVCLFDTAPRGSTSRYFGAVAAAFQLGLASGPVIGGHLLLRGVEEGLADAYMFAAADFAILLIVFAFTPPAAGEPETRVKQRLRDFMLGGLRDYVEMGRVGVVILWSTALFTACEGMVWALEPLLIRHHGMDSFEAGATLSMFIIPFIIFNIPAGAVADRVGGLNVLAPALFAAGASLILFASSEETTHMLFFAFLSTTALAFAWTSTAGLLADARRRRRMGGVVGVWNVFEELGYVVGPLLGGVIAHHSTIQAPILLLGAAMAASGLAVKFTLTRQYIGSEKQ